MKQTPRCTLEELIEACRESRSFFRDKRLGEPLDEYEEFYEVYSTEYTALVQRLRDLFNGTPTPQQIVELLTNKQTFTAFRYLAAPPISVDDLKTLAETTLSQSNLLNPVERPETIEETTEVERVEEAQEIGQQVLPTKSEIVLQVVKQILDPYRFPWVREEREPTELEIHTAIVSSSVLIASQRVETGRRSAIRDTMEGDVKEIFRAAGYIDVTGRLQPIQPSNLTISSGQFCGELKLGEHKADILARLFDGRLIAIECKGSNSAVNSEKRVNKEAVGKAVSWQKDFGPVVQVVPSSVLSGIFRPERLFDAQNNGLILFWYHRLDVLRDFIT